MSQTLAKLAQQRRFDRETETSRLRRRRLSRTNTSYPVLIPAVRSDKVVPVSYCRLGVATQVLASAQPAYFDVPGIVSSRYRAYDAPPCNFVVVVEKHLLASQVLPNTVLTALPRPNVSTKPPDHCIGIGGLTLCLTSCCCVPRWHANSAAEYYGRSAGISQAEHTQYPRANSQIRAETGSSRASREQRS